MNLYRKLPAVLGGHYSLDVLDYARQHAPIVVELFGTVGDSDAGLLADELVVCTLIDVLKAAPSAYVIDQDMIEIRLIGSNIIKQLDQSKPFFDFQSALTFV